MLAKQRAPEKGSWHEGQAAHTDGMVGVAQQGQESKNTRLKA
jgi:hypothetical protein